MKPLRLLPFILLFFFIAGFSQEKILKHTVSKGETVAQISLKYNTTSAEILKLNPDLQNGLKPNMILLIQSKSNLKSENKIPKNNTIDARKHVVTEKETVFGLAKFYNITVEDLEKANPSIAINGLKIRDTIIVPTVSKTNDSATVHQIKTEKPNESTSKNNKQIVYHQVEAKETKYSIAKQHNISIAELEASNPEIAAGLQIGFRIKIVENSSLRKTELKDVKSENKKVKIETPVEDKLEYIVKANETLYSLIKKFGMDQNELFHLNPELKKGVTTGMILKFPSDVIINDNVEKTNIDLSQKLKTDKRKKLVLLLPFNISKIENDSVNPIINRLQKDKFLNMTLDFYAGALIAIDSAKTLGLNIDITILDSDETKNSSNIVSLIEQNEFKNADVIIGPFYQSNVEKTAELIQKSKTIVISPLSKDTSKSYSNLVLATPSSELLKNAIFDYIKSKNGAILAIIDPKKIASKQYLTENQKEVRFVKMDIKGGFSADSLAKKLVKNKMNYVILDSEKTGTILKTLNTLINLMPSYQIQLVILEKNETLDFEEIPLAKLAKLKMLYPSINKDNLSPEGMIFEKEFRLINKILPNQFATRGFDLTFDTMIRLSQEESFAETIESASTEQVENKFDYQKKNNGAFTNNGIYILYYDTDLSVKIAQ